jgi:transglutaminase-like putative cysteine protease
VAMLRVDRAGVVTQASAAVELEITHSTRYEFSKPVFLEPHVLRFQPRADGAQMPLEFDLEIDPVPAGRSACLDASGNVAEQVWFDGLHDSLSITARSVVAMLRENPFDYLPNGGRTRLPAFYGEDVDSLRLYLRREPPHSGPDDVAVFAARMQAAARGELLAFVASPSPNLARKTRRVPRPGVAICRRVPRGRHRGTIRQRVRRRRRGT